MVTLLALAGCGTALRPCADPDATLSTRGAALTLPDGCRPDPAISRYLERFERDGIPFNAVYGPAAPDGIVLPELLTAGAVMAALDDAAKEKRDIAGQP